MKHDNVATSLLLGLGKGKGEIVLRTGDGDERFRELIRAVRLETGL